MANKKVFISYDYDNDRHYKYMLSAWDENKNIDFFMTDKSADVSINSEEEAVIKRAISAKINNSTYVIFLIGKYFHKSKWCKWEIEKARELNKKLIAILLDTRNTIPGELFDCCKDVEWIDFRKASLLEALSK